MRAYATSPLEVEQLPAPFKLGLTGQWAGASAGGSRDAPTWLSNPQYLISCNSGAILVVSLLLPSIASPLLAQSDGQPPLALQLALVRPEHSPAGLVRRAVLPLADEVVAEADGTVAALNDGAAAGCSAGEAVIVVAMDPEVPYLIVPSLSAKGIECPYELRLFSSAPLELLPQPDAPNLSLVGGWDAATAGGCDLHASWTTNPAYWLALPPQPCSLRQVPHC